MTFRMTCMVALAAISFAACESMEGSEYADIDDDPQMAAIGASMPRPPVMQTPSAPAMPAMPAQTGGPSKVTPAPAPVGCSSPNVSIRTEVEGSVEIKCAAPPMAPPASLKCASPEVLTWLTRNGTSSYVCMK